MYSTTRTQTLSKLSKERPLPLLRANTLPAILTPISFFPVTIQRTTLTMAATLVTRIPRDCFDEVMTATQLVIPMLASNQDEASTAGIVLFLSRVVTALSTSSTHLTTLTTPPHPLITSLLTALTQSLTDTSIYSHVSVQLMIRMLVCMARASCEVMTILLEKGEMRCSSLSSHVS